MATFHGQEPRIVTMEKALEEQLERMRRLNERLNDINRGVAENTELISRDREAQRHNPLHEVRDYRTHHSQSRTSRGNESSDDRPRHSGRPPSRKRRS